METLNKELEIHREDRCKYEAKIKKLNDKIEEYGWQMREMEISQQKKCK